LYNLVEGINFLRVKRSRRPHKSGVKITGVSSPKQTDPSTRLWGFRN